MKCRFQWYDSIFIVLFCYLLILQIQAIWPFTVDDMYISLRYARNWAAGDGLLWNIDAPPVEGYSNFSFVVLGALSFIFNTDPVFVLKTAGFTGLVATCIFVYLISRFWFLRRESLLPCLVLLLYKGQIIWSVSGLETTVYQALLCACVYFIFRGLGYPLYSGSMDTPLRKPRSVFMIYSGVFLALAGMTRPEAPALMILFFLLICWDKPKEGRKAHWQGVLYFCLALALTYFPYFLWRWYYYGFLFPNSIYCKGFTKTLTSLDGHYLKLIWPFALLAVPACIRSQDKRHYFLWLPSLVYLLLLVDADPVVAFDNRLFLPAFVLLLPLALQGLSQILLGIFKDRDAFYTVSLFTTTCILAGTFMPWMTLSQYRYFSENPIKGETLRLQVGQWLKENASAGDNVVLGDSGLIPYLSQLNFTDSYCLNNLAMAHYLPSQRYEQFCHHILLEKPDIIILTSLTEQGEIIYAPSDACLKISLNNHKDYKLDRIFSTDSSLSTYKYELFKKF
jgi:hypothetical protein